MLLSPGRGGGQNSGFWGMVKRGVVDEIRTVEAEQGGQCSRNLPRDLPCFAVKILGKRGRWYLLRGSLPEGLTSILSGELVLRTLLKHLLNINN